jgi:hypothetical protein
MQWLLAISFMFFTSLGWCAGATEAPSVSIIKGQVLEVKDVDSYTYLLLKTASGETWTAVQTAQVKKGATVTVEDAAQMDNFESKTLKRTFPKIFFGRLARPSLTTAEAAAQVATAHSAAPKSEFSGDAKVAKASGPQARTVAEVVAQRAALKDQSVTIRARVVKYSASIMGKNWLHLRDGSGTSADANNDLVATTQEQVKVGDVVLIKGIVRKDKNFGAGYAYPVMIEEAKLQK